MEPKVNFLEDDWIFLAATAARISQSSFEKKIEELYQSEKENEEKSLQRVKKIVEQYHHLILGDFSNFGIAIENTTRLASLYFWRMINKENLIFGAGIETSQRVVSPIDFHFSLTEFGAKTLVFYQKLINEFKIPPEDARYILPLGVFTRLFFSAPPRYLAKIASELEISPLLELRKIGEKISKIIKEKFKVNFPREKLISTWNFWGKEEINEKIKIRNHRNLYFLAIKMGIKGSLAMFHQLVRQRGILVVIEPLEAISENSEFIVPPTFSKEALEIYKELAKEAKENQKKLIKRGDPSFAYFLLLGQRARAKIYGFSFGILEAIKNRLHGTAQWEIRNTFAIPLFKKILKLNSELKEFLFPPCQIEGKCFEPLLFRIKKSVCPIFVTQMKKLDLEKFLELLSVKYDVFKI